MKFFLTFTSIILFFVSSAITVTLFSKCTKAEEPEETIKQTIIQQPIPAYQPTGEELEALSFERSGLKEVVFFDSTLTTNNFLLAAQPDYQHIQEIWNKKLIDTVTLRQIQYVPANILGTVCSHYEVTISGQNYVKTFTAYARYKGASYGFKPSSGNNDLYASNQNVYQSLRRHKKTIPDFRVNCGIMQTKFLYTTETDYEMWLQGNHPTSCLSNIYQFTHKF